MRRIVTTLTVLLVVSSAIPAGAAAAAPHSAEATADGQQAEAYNGAHVSFEVQNSAVTNYTVDGDTVAEAVVVESQSEHENRVGVGTDASLSAVTDVAGTETSLAAQSSTQATVETGGSAEIATHDNENGVLVVAAGDESQYVEAAVGENAEAESESDSRVVATTDNGARTAFIVVGDGEVTVNEDGNVTADLGEESRLVTRTYTEERSDDDQRTEAYIENGTATAEVYVTERDGEAVADTIRYGQDTTVEVSERTESEVRMTAERAQEEGTVVITSVSEAALAASDSLSVTVDGEAAVEASSYAELREAADGGDSSAYVVRQSSGAEATADVLVAVNHFSEREIAVSGVEDGSDSSDDGETTSDGSDDGDDSTDDASDSDGQPGFGVTAALVALISVALARIRA